MRFGGWLCGWSGSWGRSDGFGAALNRDGEGFGEGGEAGVAAAQEGAEERELQ